jgi:glycosyltransferase involved in cell wall biosynthesis
MVLKQPPVAFRGAATTLERMKQRIAIDGTAALAQGGGIGRFTRGLIQGLAAYDRETPYTIVHARDAGGQRPSLPPNFRWRSTGLTEKQATWLWHRLRLPLPADLWLGNPSLYHSPDFTLPPLARARGVVTVHDLSFEALSDVHEPALRRYLQRSVPYSVERADHIFADSESTRQEVMRWYGVAPARISVVYPGVDTRFRVMNANVPEDARQLERVQQEFDLHPGFLLSIGTLEPRKNVTTTIRAFSRYAASGATGTILVIAGGDGWLGQRETLEKLVRDLGLEDQVRFLGYVADPYLPALINLARALIYPSRYEGFGLPVLEALACGVPVITARNTSLPEAGGEAARYIDEAEDDAALAREIQRVLHDAGEREKMIARGLEHAARFTWEATARRVVELYETVLFRSG